MTPLQQPLTDIPIGREARADMGKVVDAIRSIVQSLRISGRAAEHQLGISSAQLYILQELAEQPAQSINELAERTFTHQSSVSMVVSRLVEGRLVTRTAARGDARRLSISLTPAGRALLRRAPDAAQTQLVEGLQSMSRGELHALARHLGTLTSVIGEQSAAEDEEPVLRPKVVRRA
jgi:DNA-binding MarR family transcriptional regulator